MKKIIALLLISSLIFTFSACQSDAPKGAEGDIENEAGDAENTNDDEDISDNTETSNDFTENEDAEGDTDTTDTNSEGEVDLSNGQWKYTKMITTDGGGTTDYTYEYDDKAQIIKSTYVQNDEVITYDYEYSYDDLGRLISNSYTVSGLMTTTLRYFYNDVGLLIRESYDNGNFQYYTDYVYDDNGRLTQKNSLELEWFITYEYDENGNVSVENDSRWGVTEYTYNDNGLLVSSVTYILDTYGNRTLTNYEYDDQNRLIKETQIDEDSGETVKTVEYTDYIYIQVA